VDGTDYVTGTLIYKKMTPVTTPVSIVFILFYFFTFSFVFLQVEELVEVATKVVVGALSTLLGKLDGQTWWFVRRNELFFTLFGLFEGGGVVGSCRSGVAECRNCEPP